MDENALQYLKHYGYLTEMPAGVVSLAETNAAALALEQFQKFVGLPVTGLMDEATLEMMQRPRCGNPDVLHVTGDALPAKWQKPVINVWVENWLPTSIVPQSVQEGIVATALGNKEAWGEHITSKFRLIATGRWDIKIFCARIDGPGSILAQAYLADGRDSQLTLQLDSSESKWGLIKGSAEANLLGVLQHELTHNLGLGHLQVREALMFPYANSNIISPQKPDIEAVLRLGYQKATGEPEDPEDPEDPQTPCPSICAVHRAYFAWFNEKRHRVLKGEPMLTEPEQAKVNALGDACKNVDWWKIISQLLGACQPPPPAAASGPCAGLAALIPCCGAIQECRKIFLPR